MDRTIAMKHLNIALAALGDLTRQPARSLVVTGCLVGILFPYMTLLGISEGLRIQAEISLEEGADRYVSSDQYGAAGPVRIDEILKELTELDGVRRIRPRVVGRTYFADQLVAIVGLDREALGKLEPLVQGNVPGSPGEVLVGKALANRFGLNPGVPFTLAANKRKVLRATGTLSPTCSWNSSLLAMHLADANDFFGMGGYASHALVSLTTSSTDQRTASNMESPKGGSLRLPRFRVTDREEGMKKFNSACGLSSGTGSILLVIGLVPAIPALVMTAGFGSGDLRREIGVMRATGWSAREIIEKAAFENVAIAVAAVSFAVLLASVWIKGLNGPLVAQLFISEVGLIPSVPVPFTISPAHVLLLFWPVLGLTLSGGIISAWAASRALPGQSVR